MPQQMRCMYTPTKQMNSNMWKETTMKRAFERQRTPDRDIDGKQMMT